MTTDLEGRVIRLEERYDSLGDAIKSLVDDVRWIRNTFVCSVLIGILLGVLALLMRA